MKLTSDFIRYLVVGGSAFLIDFTLLILLTEIFGFHYLISAPIAFVIALMFNYLFCIKWVFKYRIYTNNKIELSIFCIVGLIGIFITEMLLILLTPIVGNYMIVKIISCAVVLFWNFFMRRYLLFRPKEPLN